VSAAYTELVRRHLARFWPNHGCESLMWTLGSWSREHPEFRVLELAPAGGAPWIYVSAGAAHLRSFGGVGHEFVIRTWAQERLMVELLAMVASYSTREDHGGLHDGHTVPIGYPWVEGAEADHLYLNRPYFVSRDFASLRVDDSFSVQFLWLVPITERETKWRHEHGQESFEQWLEDHAVTPEDPTRRSTV
jgi:hypothetical protein